MTTLLGKHAGTRCVVAASAVLLAEFLIQPMQRSVNLLHELGHWLAVTCSGGAVQQVAFNGTEGHVAFTGGHQIIIYFSGYALPLLVFGAFIGLTSMASITRWVGILLLMTSIIDLVSDFALRPQTGDLATLAEATSGWRAPWIALYAGITIAAMAFGLTIGKLWPLRKFPTRRNR